MALSDARRLPVVAILAILPSAAEGAPFGLPGLGSSERPVKGHGWTILCCLGVAMKLAYLLPETHPLLGEKIGFCPLLLSQPFRKSPIM